MYEIVWLQMLQLVIGSSAVSLGVLLATFMGGMCWGSLTWPRLVAEGRHPLKVYAVLEAGIGVIGLLVLMALPLAGNVYASIASLGFTGVTLRAVVAAVCLLPPTFMMGATLPVIARWVETTPRGISWLGFFYAGNIVGAVLGCLLAGFYLLRVHDMAFATYCAAGLNFVVAAAAYALALYSPNRAAGAQAPRDERARAPLAWAVYVTLALSGLCALSAEVIWTRLLSLMLGGTVYTFSLILGVFLAGLGIGSGVGSLIAQVSRRPRVVLGWCQLLQAAAVAWAAGALARVLPFWPIDVYLSSDSSIGFQMDLVRCAYAVLPSALLWGASFPLALASLAAPGQDPGRLVGGAYAANTVGAIAGSLAGGLVLVPGIGTQHAQQFLIGLTVISALLAFGSHWSIQAGSRAIGAAAGAVGAVVAAIWLVGTVPAIPGSLVAYGRELMLYDLEGSETLYIGEGLNATVGVTEQDSVVKFHVAGKVEASTLPEDMRLQRMLGHLPALFHPNPKSVLIVGFGAGVTAGCFVNYPGIERIVICEIEPLIPQFVGPHFSAQNYDIVNDPRVEIVYDDARHYILTSNETFDIITSDPIHPWVKGAASLYTTDYFELVKERLNPGGFVTQWVPFYQSDEAVVKSELATFFEAFPGGTIWGNDFGGVGYDVVMLGQKEPTVLDAEAINDRIVSQGYSRVQQSLLDVGFGSVLDIFSLYAGRDEDLRGFLADAEINRDRNLRLQYLAGLQISSNAGSAMYAPMLGLRRFPADIFGGSDLVVENLRRVMNLPE